MEREIKRSMRMRGRILSGMLAAAVALPVPVLAQQTTPGSAPQTTPGSAPQTTPGSQLQPQEGQVPGQAPGAPAVQPPTGQVPGTPQGFGPFQQNPWFADPMIRQNMGINDDVFSRLRDTYSQSWDRYNQALTGLQNTLTPQQRAARIRELQDAYYGDLYTGPGQVLDPQMQQRYNQMYLQYLGPNAFSLPYVQQQLRLTARQRQQLMELQQRWYQQMQRLSQNFENDPDGQETFIQLRNRALERIRQILDEEQLAIWQQLMGTPFEFPVRAYFPTPTLPPTVNGSPVR